jgi:putative ATPase
MKINFLQDFKPKKLNEIFGQEQLTAEGKILSAMVCIQKPYSLLIYGPTSCGKTSLAIVLCNELKREFLLFNASVDNKNLLTEMVAEAKEKQKILIIDEIHRMNKNVIEYLLPFLDNNEVIVFGLTTESIFYTIPAAIRSRCFSCRLNPITPAIVFMILQYQCTKHKVKIEPTILKKISVRSNGDVRTAIRMLEMMSEYRDATNTTFEQIDTFFPEGLDFTTENATSYYDMLSALHKSCRGSDVNAALY